MATSLPKVALHFAPTSLGKILLLEPTCDIQEIAASRTFVRFMCFAFLCLSAVAEGRVTCAQQLRQPPAQETACILQVSVKQGEGDPHPPFTLLGEVTAASDGYKRREINIQGLIVLGFQILTSLLLK